MRKEIHKCKFDEDNFSVVKNGDTLEVDLMYPPREIPSAGDKGACKFVQVNQASVRASDGIRIHYDYLRNGFVIEQPQRLAWESGDPVCDPMWKEVAFVQSWGSELPEVAILTGREE